MPTHSTSLQHCAHFPNGYVIPARRDWTCCRAQLHANDKDGMDRRKTLAAFVALALTLKPIPLASASSEAVGGALPSAQEPITAAGEPTKVYFGNGCFWGRQKEFVDLEKALGRTPEQVSNVTCTRSVRGCQPSQPLSAWTPSQGTATSSNSPAA
jgi:hypothetical protein